MGQLAGLLVINLIFGLVVPNIDNLAHMGGLVTGAWLGFLFGPVRAQTMRSMWTRPSATGALVPVFGTEGTRAIRIGGLLALGLAFLALWAIGRGRPGTLHLQDPPPCAGRKRRHLGDGPQLHQRKRRHDAGRYPHRTGTRGTHPRTPRIHRALR